MLKAIVFWSVFAIDVLIGTFCEIYGICYGMKFGGIWPLIFGFGAVCIFGYGFALLTCWTKFINWGLGKVL